MIFTNHIPGFVEQSMDALYGSLYATLMHLQLHEATAQTSTYARWCDERLVALFLFRQEGSKVQVVNEGMQLDLLEVEKFCSHIFDQYDDVTRIDFHAVQIDAPVMHRPGFCFRCSEDIVITLPASREDYNRQLGKSTRKNLRRHLARAQRDLPGFRFDVESGSALSERTIRSIIGFNHARMAGKRRASALTGQSEARLIRLIQQRGTVGMIHVNDQLCGGSLACRVGNDLYSLVNAHDPQYNAYGLGNLCRYLMIMDAIGKGDRRFHLLGGNFHTKQDMLGRRLPLDHCIFYRSAMYVLPDIGRIASYSLQSLLYHLRNWIQAQRQKKENSRLARLLDRTISGVRHSRRTPAAHL